MLREYQSAMIDETRAQAAKGSRAVCVVAPTGSGKTHVASAMIASAREKLRSVLFLAPRRELIYQCCDKLDSVSVAYGVIMAGEHRTMMQDVQVACVPTLHARTRREIMDFPSADLVIADEAHIGIGGQSQKILERYKASGAVVIGLTATPARVDGKGLGAVYDSMVLGPSIRELTERGYLVPARYYAGEKPDMEGVKVQAGDYQQKQMGERVDQPKLIGDIVSNWCRLAPDRQTFVFAANVAHSKHLCDEFKAVGISAEHLDGTTDHFERKEIQERLRSGGTQVIVNCQVMTYGVDFPPVSAIVLATPTKSVTKYMQMVGRGLRTFDGKSDCMVLDHAGCVDNPDLGFIDDPRPWSLDGDTKIQERQSAQRKEPKPIECKGCGATIKPAAMCPYCGHEMKSAYKKAMEVFEADLTEVDRKTRKNHKREWTMREKALFHGELEGYRRKHRYRNGWTAHKYRERIGAWPNHPTIKNAPPREPSPETQAWIKHTNIKHAKRSERNL